MTTTDTGVGGTAAVKANQTAPYPAVSRDDGVVPLVLPDEVPGCLHQTRNMARTAGHGPAPRRLVPQEGANGATDLAANRVVVHQGRQPRPALDFSEPVLQGAERRDHLQAAVQGPRWVAKTESGTGCTGAGAGSRRRTRKGPWLSSIWYRWLRKHTDCAVFPRPISSARTQLRRWRQLLTCSRTDGKRSA